MIQHVKHIPEKVKSEVSATSPTTKSHVISNSLGVWLAHNRDDDRLKSEVREEEMSRRWGYIGKENMKN